MTISDHMLETIERYHMVSPGDGVVIAVSGGADSMALLHLLEELREKRALTLHVAHLNHRLRPDAEEDAEFVRAAARRLGISATIESADVRAIAAREKRSIEDAGRRARYEFLAKMANEAGAQRIATAHTRDDQVETVLMRLDAGGPWELLGGIPPVRRFDAVQVVRPLREVTRQEILHYLAGREVVWREDPTNRDVRIVRNRMRHQVLPALLRDAPAIGHTAWEMGETSREIDAVLNRLAAVHYGHLPNREHDTITVAQDSFAALPDALQRRFLRMAVTEVAGTGGAPSLVMLEEAVRVASAGRVGREVPAGGAVVRVGYGMIEVAPARPHAAAAAYRLPVPGEVRAEGFGLVFSADLLEQLQEHSVSGPHEALFDADAAGSPLEIRAWRTGDRFVPSGLTGKKKLQDFFVDAKVPRWQRATVPLVADAQDRILWVVGYRVAETGRVTQRTNRVLRVRARPA
ncbi:MAG: tRNA lysidine(34) synthetase TilS [bacterium]